MHDHRLSLQAVRAFEGGEGIGYSLFARFMRDHSDQRRSVGDFALNQTTTVRARALSDTNWSALTEAAFTIIRDYDTLLVTELMGSGVNYVTGDYSRGASGFWIENGEIAYPVHEITIAGNMKDMLKGVEAVGSDAYNYGAKTVGSILVNRMTVAGS